MGAFAGARVFVAEEPGVIEVSVHTVADTLSEDEAGSLGRFLFRFVDTQGTRFALAEFAGHTPTGISRPFFGQTGRVVAVSLPEIQRLPEDFDQDGEVNFPDFLFFALAFGRNLGEEGYQSVADFDANGSIDFADFLAFASAFGSSLES